jgi:tetratricopeptide (TPR) repeat protein
MITAAVRKQALDLAESWRDDPARFLTAASDVVHQTWAPPSQYREALAWAQTACRSKPNNAVTWLDLAAAQYRLKKYQEAFDSLSKVDKLPPSDEGAILGGSRFSREYLGRHETSAILAMVQYQLGQKEQARTLLTGLKEWDQRQEEMAYPELLELIREAEALLMGPKQ